MQAVRLVPLLLLTLATPAAAQSAGVWAGIDVPGGWSALSQVGLTEEDGPDTLLILARRLHANPPGASPPGASQAGRLAVDQLAQALADPHALGAGGSFGPSATVPILFSPDHWRDLVGARGADDERLFAALVQDRAAMLLHYGLAAAGRGVQALVADDRDLLRWLHRHAAGATALAGASLRLEDGAIVVPGGQDAEALWEGLTGASPRQPAAFLRALLSTDRGRLAWFFDTLMHLEAGRQMAALAVDAGADQRARVQALYQTFRSTDSNWLIDARPFVRTQADAAAILTSISVADGHVAPPHDLGLWTYVFRRSDAAAPPDTRELRLAGEPATLDWLAREITRAELRERRDRLDQVLFAQRVFARAPPGSEGDVGFTLVHYQRFRALLLTLDRLTLTDPADYVAAILAARHADSRPRTDRHEAIVTFQAALALVIRAHWAGSLSDHAAADVTRALARAVDGAPHVPAAVAGWITTTFSPSLPRLLSPDALTGRTAYEARILQGLAGRLGQPGRPALSWEGLDYVVDPAASEFARLREARARLESPGLDAAIAHPRANGLGEALQALVYAAALGDPAGPAFFSRDVHLRHDFAFDSPSSQRRAVIPWTVPREAVADGGPWRGMGALLNLDLAMARLALRRLVEQDMPPAPSIGANDAHVLARTVVLLRADALTDDARDEIVAALARGRARVAEAGRDPVRLDALAAEAGVSPWRRALVPWMVAHDPAQLDTLFARRDLLWLGQPALPVADLDRWGAYAEPLAACLCARMPSPTPWERHGGRTDAGQMATQTVELILRLAEETAEMALPAALVPALMAYAVQDHIHDIEARMQDDWPATARAARRLARARIEDYVAALAGTVLQPR